MLVFLLSTPFWLLGTVPERTLPIDLPFNLPISALVAFCPMIAALILVYRKQGAIGAKQLLKGMSLFSTVLFHTTINVSEFSFPNLGSHYDPLIATILIALTVAIVTFLWGAQTLARFRYA